MSSGKREKPSTVIGLPNLKEMFRPDIAKVRPLRTSFDNNSVLSMWLSNMDRKAGLFDFRNVSSPGWRAANESLVGARTVNEPRRSSIESKPAIFSRSARTLKSFRVEIASMMVPVVVGGPTVVEVSTGRIDVEVTPGEEVLEDETESLVSEVPDPPQAEAEATSNTEMTTETDDPGRRTVTRDPASMQQN
jgi:hypothetical protein